MIEFDITEIIALLLPEAVHERIPPMTCKYDTKTCTLEIGPLDDPTGEYEFFKFNIESIESVDAARTAIDTVLRVVTTMGVIHTHPELPMKLSGLTGRNTHIGRVIAMAGAALHQLFHGTDEEPITTHLFLYNVPGYMSPNTTFTCTKSTTEDNPGEYLLTYNGESVPLTNSLKSDYIEYMQSDAIDWPGTVGDKSQFIRDIEARRAKINDLLTIEGF